MDLKMDFDDQDPFEGMTEEMEEEIREELHRTAEDMASIARAMAPHDTGKLEQSIQVHDGDYVPENPNVRGVAASPQAGRLSVTVSAGDADAFYASFVEHGTQKMDPSPFFEPAREAVADAFEERMSDILERRK